MDSSFLNIGLVGFVLLRWSCGLPAIVEGILVDFGQAR